MTIDALTLSSWDDTEPDRPIAIVDVACSAGTYMRALARDLGSAVGERRLSRGAAADRRGPVLGRRCGAAGRRPVGGCRGPGGPRPAPATGRRRPGAVPRTVLLSEREVAAVAHGQYIRPAAGRYRRPVRYRLRRPGPGGSSRSPPTRARVASPRTRSLSAPAERPAGRRLMDVVAGRRGLRPEHGPVFAVIGVFDGLHRGHLYLLDHLVREAAHPRSPADASSRSTIIPTRS